ncbi:hypothetical protein AAG570_002845 [Ranatra chinensis]|uniref:Uncharacterized protein n=1 Tax=Ranatra chinensis TaxID=642074 RepID=A0ABD0Y671_9HEMI
MEDCPDHESLPCKIIGNKLRKYNRTTYLYDVNISLPEAISDDIELSVAVSSFGNGGWSKNQIEQKLGPMCTAMRTFLPDSMKALLKAFGQKDCPIKPGFYVIKDFQQHTNIKWPLIPYGSYKKSRCFMGGAKCAVVATAIAFPAWVILAVEATLELYPRSESAVVMLSLKREQRGRRNVPPKSAVFP